MIEGWGLLKNRSNSKRPDATGAKLATFHEGS
jgi:hypothetical protein